MFVPVWKAPALLGRGRFSAVEISTAFFLIFALAFVFVRVRVLFFFSRACGYSLLKCLSLMRLAVVCVDKTLLTAVSRLSQFVLVVTVWTDTKGVQSLFVSLFKGACGHA